MASSLTAAACAALLGLALSAPASACDDPSDAATAFETTALQGCKTEKDTTRYCKKWRATCKKTVKVEAQCNLKRVKINLSETMAECKADIIETDPKACIQSAKVKAKPDVDFFKGQRTDGLGKCEAFNCESNCFI
jgi:hypothetical protein